MKMEKIGPSALEDNGNKSQSEITSLTNILIYDTLSMDMKRMFKYSQHSKSAQIHASADDDINHWTVAKCHYVRI